MELTLKRVDFLQVGVTNRGCLRLLPPPKRTAPNTPLTQKIVVGDHEGVVTCFGMRNLTINLSFKTLPGPPISSLCLSMGESGPTDNVFVTSGPDVRGYTKKGKPFLVFDTNLTESIQALFATEKDLLVACNYIFNHYVQCKDCNYFLSPDRINAVLRLPIPGTSHLYTVLACQDRVLRLMQDSEMFYEVEVPGPPSCLILYNHTGGENHDEVMYGTSDGKIGLVKLGMEAPVHRWDLSNDKRLGGISDLDMFDMTRDGKMEILVARDDGDIEVYALDEMGEPQLIFSHSLSEGATSIQGGMVSQPYHPEAIVSTYSGKILAMSSAPQTGGVHLGSAGVESADPELQARIDLLKKEIEELETNVQRGRDTYEQSAQSNSAISAIPKFSVSTKFTLHQEDASYTLSVELSVPIESVVLQSNVPIDLLDTDKNTAVVSHCQCDPDHGNYLLATYRCQSNTTRMELKLRSIEGQHGTLQAYITPRIHPKSCRRKEFQIKPLSLHQRTHLFDSYRPLNNLTLSGPFSLSEVHSWLYFCLPEVPERPPTEDAVSLHFRSTFLDTQLDAFYKAGEAVFRSDNVSTISILKDVLTREATKNSIQLQMSCTINDESVPYTLQLIHPKLDYQLLLAKRVHIIEALQELKYQESDVSFLATDYLYILENAQHLREEFKQQPCHLERLYGMITDLFIDKFKFKGMNVKSRVNVLLDLLENNYELDRLLSFFEGEQFE